MPTRPPHHWTRVLPPVLACALLWGSAFPAIKLVYREWDKSGLETDLFDLWWFAGLRFTIAGLALLLISRQPLAELKASPPRLIAAMVGTQTFGQYVFFYLALALATGSLSSLLVSTGSFWWLILAPLILKTPWPNRMQWLAIAIGAIGVTLATYSPAPGSQSSLWGAVFMLLATLMGALGVITFSKLRPTIGPRAATGSSLFLGGLLLSLLGLPAIPNTAELFSPKILLITLWLCFVSAAAFTLWNHLSTQHPVHLLASYRFLIPVAGLIESLLLIPGEQATPGLLFGGLLIIISLIAAQRLTLPPPAPPANSDR